MKQKDILLIGVIVIVSAVVSVVLSNLIISPPKHRQQKVEVVEPISADFKTPDTAYFNSNSIDPTQLVQISNNNNSQPFNTPSH